jgi:hypothetical protein
LTPSNLGTYAIIAIVAGGIGYATANKINNAADYRAMVAQLQQNIVILRNDKAQAELDKVKLSELALKTKEAADALLDPNGECFNSNDAEQLRSLWK